MKEVVNEKEFKKLLTQYGLPLMDAMAQHQTRLLIKGKRFVLECPVEHGEKIEIKGKLEPILNRLKNKWWVRSASSGKRIMICVDPIW